MQEMRIFLAGVGGQGTLTATNLLSLMGLDKGLDVCSGEIHGMAQRGGIVESTVLLGGYLSPRIDHGEADVLLGFEPLESLRALPYLRPGRTLLSNSDPTYPVGVSLGRETYPGMEHIRTQCAACAGSALFIPCKELAERAGTVQCANMVLLGAFCALQESPFDPDDLGRAVSKYLPAKIRDVNLEAARLGGEAAKA
jgi:indolepyruvate ferredoxin oxidoreductase beta subunit